MSKKNYVGMLFASMLVFGLAACGDDNPSGSKDVESSSSVIEECDEDDCDEELDEKSSSSKKVDGKSSDSKSEGTNSSGAESEGLSSSSVEKDGGNSSSVMNDKSSSSVATGSSVISKGEFKDRRDGQVYKTVKIGDWTWMAENLNYDPGVVSGKYAWNGCYMDVADSCAKYGRLYAWDLANNVCPTGWHLPTNEEWQTLFDAVGGSSAAGTALKSGSGWLWDNENDRDGNGLDAYGFSVIPSGGYYRWSNGIMDFDNIGEYAHFWSASVLSATTAYQVYLYNDADGVFLDFAYKQEGISVRCLQINSCGGEEYDESKEKCVDGVINKMCGTTYYPTDKQFCVDETIYDKCGGEEYDVSKEKCVKDVLYPACGSSYYIPGDDARCLNDKVIELSYGELKDSRDGQTYKTISIGKQTWMAENLNYDPGDVSNMGKRAWSGCYGYSADSCAKYGRLYTWDVAVDNVNCGNYNFCELSGAVRGVCPVGWFLPTKENWLTLISEVGGAESAGWFLKSYSGWNGNGNGSDAYGFSALPAGYRYEDGLFTNAGIGASFWSSTQQPENCSIMGCFGYGAFAMNLYERIEYNAELINAYDDRGKGFSVRCVQESN